MLAGNPIEFHVAARIQHSKEPAVHRLDEFIGPCDRSHTAASFAIERKTGFLEDIQPFHFLMPVRLGQTAKTQRNEAIHRHLQTLIKLPVDALNAKDLSDFTTRERNGLSEVVLKCENTERNKNTQVLLGRKAQLRISLYLPRYVEFCPVRQKLCSLDLEFANTLAYPTFQYCKRNRCEIFLFDGQV